MKNVVKKLTLVITLLIAFGVQAQDRKEKIKNMPPEEKAALRADKMSEKLGLDDNQKVKVKEIFATQQKENKVVMEEARAEREKARSERRESMKKQHEALKVKLKPILSEEQFKKWEAMQKENMEKAKERRKHKKE